MCPTLFPNRVLYGSRAPGELYGEDAGEPLRLYTDFTPPRVGPGVFDFVGRRNAADYLEISPFAR